jgi:serine/threonine-protein kinase
MMTAGDDAIRRFDDHGAALWYSRALSMSRSMLARDAAQATARFVDASVRLADVMRFSGLLGLASGTLDEAALMQPNLLQSAAIARARGRVAIAGGSAENGCRHLREAIGLALRIGDRDFVCETYVDLAGALREEGDPVAAAGELTEGINLLTMGEGLGGQVTASRLWLLGLRLAELHLQAGDECYAEAVALLSLRHADREDAPQGRGRLFALLGRITSAAGKHEQSLAHRARAIDEMRRIGDRRSTAELLIENARATADLKPITATARARRIDDAAAGATRIAHELATEIGWDEGATLAASFQTSWALH